MPRKTLYEIRCGRCRLENRRVEPLLTRGTLAVEQDPEEGGLVRLCWRNRQVPGEDELDLVALEGDAEFDRVAQSSGRVYCLRLATSGERHFFWLQEPDESRDDELAPTIAAFISDPPAVLDNPENDERERSPVRSELPASLHELLASIRVPGAPGRDAAEAKDVSLSALFSREKLARLLDAPGAVEALRPHMPPELAADRTSLLDALTSPPCRQTLHAIARALRSGHLGPLLAQFGLPEHIYSVRELLAHISRLHGPADPSNGSQS